MYLYGNYLKEIKNDPEKGDEMIEKHFKLQTINMSEEGEQNEVDSMFAEDTVIVVISGVDEDMGKISKVSSGISKLFGYSNYEVEGQDVSILMPSLIGS